MKLLGQLVQFILLIHSCVGSGKITRAPPTTTLLPGAGVDPASGNGNSDDKISFFQTIASSTVVGGLVVDPTLARGNSDVEFSTLSSIASTTMIAAKTAHLTPSGESKTVDPTPFGESKTVDPTPSGESNDDSWSSILSLPFILGPCAIAVLVLVLCVLAWVA